MYQKMKSALLNGKEFWVHETEFKPKDGLPCFNRKEIDLMRGYKDKLSEKMMREVYHMKSLLPVELNLMDFLNWENKYNWKAQHKLNQKQVNALHVRRCIEAVESAKINTQEQSPRLAFPT